MKEIKNDFIVDTKDKLCKLINMIKSEYVNFPVLIMFFAPIFSGLLNDFFVFVAIIACVVGIGIKSIKNEKLKIPKGKNIVFILIYVFSFLIIEFYAIDKGLNLIGFIKCLLVPLFIILCMQYDEVKDKILNVIPYSGLLSLVVSAFLILFNNPDIIIDNRLNGTFFYANSYALFLLIGIYILIYKEKPKIYEIAISIILSIGILLTKSRGVEILFAIMIVAIGFYNYRKYKKIPYIQIGFVVIFGIALIVFGLNNRFSGNIFKSGEFDLRLIYYKDALNMIGERPGGYGYQGYYYSQTETQTAPYYTKSVHNFILQLFLDSGIIPALCIIVFLINTYLDKEISINQKVIVSIILIHSLIDINFEYFYYWLLVCTIANFEKFDFCTKAKYTRIVSAIATLIIMPLLVSSAYFEFKSFKESHDIIPFNTRALIEDLYMAKDFNTQLDLAKKIYSLNQNVTSSLQVLSVEQQNKSNYLDAISYEKKILRLNRLDQEAYNDYYSFLKKSFLYYNTAKDYNNLKIVMDDILEIKELMQRVNTTTNPDYVALILPTEDMKKSFTAIKTLYDKE